VHRNKYLCFVTGQFVLRQKTSKDILRRNGTCRLCLIYIVRCKYVEAYIATVAQGEISVGLCHIIWSALTGMGQCFEDYVVSFQRWLQGSTGDRGSHESYHHHHHHHHHYTHIPAGPNIFITLAMMVSVSHSWYLWDEELLLRSHRGKN
jgi:hypothetical protein